MGAEMPPIDYKEKEEMTLGELKSAIVDLGFEDSKIIEQGGEYFSVCINAINRATSILYATVIFPYKDALEAKEQIAEKPTVITSETQDDVDMNICPLLEHLMSLLASHYVWLDDNPSRATSYFNQYQVLKEEILMTIVKPIKAEITGGVL